jgi:hypothetical protein
MGALVDGRSAAIADPAETASAKAAIARECLLIIALIRRIFRSSIRRDRNPQGSEIADSGLP